MNKFSESNGILGEFNANLSSFGVNLSNQILSLPCARVVQVVGLCK